MKLFFSLATIVAGAMASELSLSDNVARAVASDRALRGNPNPLEMTNAEQERETLLLCTIISRFIPGSGCSCINSLFDLSLISPARLHQRVLPKFLWWEKYARHRPFQEPCSSSSFN